MKVLFFVLFLVFANLYVGEGTMRLSRKSSKIKALLAEEEEEERKAEDAAPIVVTKKFCSTYLEDLQKKMPAYWDSTKGACIDEKRTELLEGCGKKLSSFEDAYNDICKKVAILPKSDEFKKAIILPKSKGTPGKPLEGQSAFPESGNASSLPSTNSVAKSYCREVLDKVQKKDVTLYNDECKGCCVDEIIERYQSCGKYPNLHFFKRLDNLCPSGNPKAAAMLKDFHKVPIVASVDATESKESKKGTPTSPLAKNERYPLESSTELNEKVAKRNELLDGCEKQADGCEEKKTAV